MQKILFSFILTFFTYNVFSQTNYEKFKKIYEKKDTTKIKAFLAKWEKTDPNDPEFYTSAINYYFNYSQQEIISLTQKHEGNERLKLTDSTGDVAGFLNSSLGYNPQKVSKAIEYANKGMEKFPNRLDIIFGKCRMLMQIKDYNNLTKALLKTVEYSQINKNNWLWTENKKQENGEAFFLESMQSFLKELYDTEDDNLLPNMVQIGEATLKYYKSNVEILSTTSVALLLLKKFDKAIDYLKQAEKINPKDFIVLNNIAQAYKLKEDKVNAIKYYELTEKYGDESAKKQARDIIKELKK